MMIHFTDWPIRQKITFLVVSISGLATLFASIIFACLEVCMIMDSMVDNLRVLANAVAQNSTAAISFGDTKSASSILQALSAEPDIESGTIMSPSGKVFARYGNSDYPDKTGTALHHSEDYQFVRDRGEIWLDLIYPIELNGQNLGLLYVRSTIDKLIRHIQYCAYALLATLTLATAIAFVLSARLQKVILAPLSWLAETARKISRDGNYGLRVTKQTNDEIGLLVDNFNTMLEVIQERDQALMDHKNKLEQVVEERTSELKLKRDEALASVRAKSQFLANMSHEIRTPMNGIIGMLSLVDDADLGGEQKEYLKAASNSATTLMTIINDILDFSKIEAGKVQFEEIEFDLQSLMEDVATLFATAASDKKLELVCFIPADVHTHVRGDPTRIRQIVSNLLSNAVKFTEKGEVVLSVEEVARKQDKVDYRFSVRDSGIGIESSKLETLFDSFTQADGSTTREYGGTGLGLAVCKQLVELMGGQIGVTSKVFQGSEFWFSLCLEANFRSVHSSQESLDLSRDRVLIVDDNAINCKILEQYLKPLRVNPTVCSTAIEALGQLYDAEVKGRSFDLVFLDYHMPEKDGLELANQIEDDPRITNPHVVMLSSVDLDRNLSRAAGINAHLLKPFRRSQLYEVIHQYANAQMSDRHPSLPSPNDNLSGHILVVDDERINQMVVVAMLEKFGLESTVAHNGQVATEMFRDNRFDLILMDCHMPIMNGFDATLAIRDYESKNRLDRIPIIAMTANAMKGTREECLGCGMDEYMSKPLQVDNFRALLKQWLPINPGNDESKCVTDKEPSSDLPIWDRTLTLTQLSNDEQLLAELIELFREHCPRQLANINEAVSQGNSSALLEAAHAFKGAVGHFSAVEIKELAFRLENKARSEDMSDTVELYDSLEKKTHELLQALSV